jgi:glycosyltransferase involved in cell wall biosynthesis
MKVFILHPGKANYPEIAAYRDFLEKKHFEVYEGDVAAYASFPHHKECVLWCLMGLYRQLPPARFVIHDYRSLSVGRLASLKDGIKRTLNIRPDLRIFQNKRMRDAMKFRDGVPSLFLPMGVPDWIFGITDDASSDIPSGRFCYIGEMSRERGFHKVLSAYRVARKETTDTLILVGKPEHEIFEAFKNTDGIEFVGRMPQVDALRIVRKSEFAICYFPYHRPHCYQTPTKLLEYAALGKKIICNDSPSNVLTAKELNIASHFTGRNVFDGLLPVSQINAGANDPQRLRGLEWTAVIAESGVLEHIRTSLKGS